MILLQSSVNGLQDITFTTKDVIYIITLLIAAVSGYFIMKDQIKSLNRDVIELKDDLKKTNEVMEKEAIASKAGRSSTRKELTEDIKAREQVLHQRIDRVRDDNIKSYEKLESQITELRKEIKQDTEKIIDAIKNKK